MKQLLFWFLILACQTARADGADSSRLRISLLTCTPGAELYSVFGHNALRIVDSAAGTDIVYNYGTFDFSDPDFYTKFVRGKLNYFLSQETLNDFLYAYAYFGRGVSEQVLRLTGDEKKRLQQFLFVNVRPENKNYRYDFFYDNCSTRLRDIVWGARSGPPFVSPALVPEGTTFRDHLHVYLDRGQMTWTRLGIDIILGLEADHIMDVRESMFLPDFLELGVAKARSANDQLVEATIELLPDQQPVPTALPIYLTPLFIFIAISVLYVWVSINEKSWNRLARIADQVLFITTGVLGVFLVFMWLGTDHQSTSKNLSLVWACPFHLLLGFSFIRKFSGYRYWLMIYAVLLLLFIALGIIFPGLVNSTLYPIIAVLSLRSWLIAKSWPINGHL